MVLTNQQYKLIKDVLDPFLPTKIGIFGSFARDEADKNSDIDILVSFSKEINLFDLIGLEQELTEKIGIKVDLVTERSVNPKLKKYIEQDIKIIHG